MPIYDYKCPTCGLTGGVMRELGDTSPPDCPECAEKVGMRRQYTTFAIKAPMQPHYNMTTGTYISSSNQFSDQLKAMSEERTLRTGIEHNFVPHDPREMKDELGVTDEGLEATYRRTRDSGDEGTVRRMKREGVWL